jgi:hypothetical protein
MKLASISIAIALAAMFPLTLSATALAATPAEVQEADALFRAAQKLLSDGKTHEACEKFERSQALDAGLGTLLNLAKCHQKEGRTATARAEFDAAAKLAAARGAEDQDRADYARKQATSLDGQVATVKLDLPAGTTSVQVDGRAVTPAEWTAPIALDPGEHAFVVVGPGTAPRRASITVPAGPGTLSLAVPLAVLGAEREPSGEHPDEHRVEPIDAEDPHAGRRVAGFVVAGAGLSGVVVGAVFGARALGKKSDEKAHCSGNFCDPAGLALDSEAHGAAAISTVAMGVGLAAASVGVVLVVVSRAPKQASSGFLHVTPSVGLGSGGLDVRGTF